MKIRLFLLIFVFTNFCFQLSLLSFPKEVYQMMKAGDYKGMREVVKKTSKEEIIAPISNKNLGEDKYFEPVVYLSLIERKVTIFHIAALLKDVRGLEILLEKYPECVDIKGVFDTTPLSFACNSNDFRVLPLVDLLLKYGANINNTNDEYTSLAIDQVNPLSAACQVGNYPLVELLLLRGAKITHLKSRALIHMFFIESQRDEKTTVFMSDDIVQDSIIPIIELLFQSADESELKKLQVIVKRALLRGLVKDYIDEYIDKNEESVFGTVEQQWDYTTEFGSIKESFGECVSNVMINGGYTHRVKDEINGTEIFCNKIGTKKKIVSWKNINFVLNKLGTLLNTRYTSIENIHRSLPIHKSCINKGDEPLTKLLLAERNRDIVVNQLQTQQRNPYQTPLINNKNVVGMLESLKLGDKMVRDLTCINPKK